MGFVHGHAVQVDPRLWHQFPAPHFAKRFVIHMNGRAMHPLCHTGQDIMRAMCIGLLTNLKAGERSMTNIITRFGSRLSWLGRGCRRFGIKRDRAFGNPIPQCAFFFRKITGTAH
jgi:hypothetical protein